jgi:hypothetical protein
MKKFMAILSAAIIAFSAIVRADSDGPVTIQEYLNYNSDQVASYYTLYLSKLAESTKVDPDIRDFIYKQYVKGPDKPSADLLVEVYKLAMDQPDHNLPIKNVVDHVIHKQNAAWKASGNN